MRTLAVFLLALAADAAAQSNAAYRPTGRTAETRVSGSTGLGFSIPVVSPGHTGGGVLDELAVWQTHGVPCSVGAGYWAARDGFPTALGRFESARGFREIIQVASGDGPSRQTGTRDLLLDCKGRRGEQRARLDFPRASSGGAPRPTTRPTAPTAPRPSLNRPAVALPGHAGASAISGLRVCTDGRSDAVRGVTLYGSTINARGEGEVRRDGGLTESFESSTCRSWQPIARCAADRVAVGLSAYHGTVRSGAAEGQRVLTGLRLTCSRVSVTAL